MHNYKRFLSFLCITKPFILCGRQVYSGTQFFQYNCKTPPSVAGKSVYMLSQRHDSYDLSSKGSQALGKRMRIVYQDVLNSVMHLVSFLFPGNYSPFGDQRNSILGLFILLSKAEWMDYLLQGTVTENFRLWTVSFWKSQFALLV